MIQAYIDENTNYSQNGDMALMPTVCTIDAKLNGTWSVKLVHPIDQEGRWKYITDEAVIRMPSFNGSQLFRVYERKKSDKGVEAKLLPIFYDAAKDVFIQDKRPTYMTGQQALTELMAGTIYSGESDIETQATAYYIRKNLLECISGKDDNAFIKRWGGEAIYNNFKITLNARAGADNGVTVRYGLNLQTNGFEEIVNLSGVLTRVYPQGYNGVTSSEPVDSPLINNYPTVRCGVREYKNIRMSSDVTGGNTEGLTICYTQAELDTALRAAVEKDFEDGLDKPAVTIKAKMILLQNTEEYKEYQNLQNVSLGDTVHVYHTRLGITSQLRVIELIYDGVTDEISEVMLGDAQYNYFDSTIKTMTNLSFAVKDNTNAIYDVKSQAYMAQQEARMIRSYFWTDEYGAHVTTEPDDAENGSNVLIDAAGMAIRNGNAELATFGANLIELGKNNSAATIKLLDDKVRLLVDSELDRFMINGRPLPDGGPNYTGIVNSVPQSVIDAGHRNPQIWCQTQTSGGDDSRVVASADHIYLQAAKTDNGNSAGNIWLVGNQLSAEVNKLFIDGKAVYPYNEYSSSTQSGVHIYRVLNIVVCNIHMSGRVSTSGTSFNVGAIPVGYRPKETIVFTGQVTTSATPAGMARVVASKASGTSVSTITATANVTGTYVLYANCVWMTDD